jgi:sigma-B regulation protein RsbU (phosphoserine phosphatase)
MISPGRGSNGGSDASTLENLQRVAEAALESPDLESQLVRLLERINQTLEASTATILLVDDAGETLHPTAAAGLEKDAKGTYPIPVGEGFAGQVAADRRPAWIEDTSQSQADLVSQVLKENGVRSLFAVPLTVGDQLVGVLQVGAVEPRKFSSADRQVLETGAVLAAIAMTPRPRWSGSSTSNGSQRPGWHTWTWTTS